MVTRTARLTTLLALCVGGLWVHTLVTRLDGPPSRADRLAADWTAEYRDQALDTRTPIHLGFSRALSEGFTAASGRAELDFRSGRVSVKVDGLDPLPAGAAYEVWLVNQVPGPGHTVAIDFGQNGDLILTLGVLPATGSLVARLGATALASMTVDMVAVMRVAPGEAPAYVIGGMQSIRHQIGRAGAEERAVSTAGLPAAQKRGGGGGGGGKKLAALIAEGQDLFFNATFGGNGRTCGTCHLPDRDLTIDIDAIAGLAPSDPLFVAEFDPDLPPFDRARPTLPAMEDPDMMRTRGLILENIRGFDVDAAGDLLFPPVFRATPSLFNLEFTAPYGLSDCCPDLQDFSAGAVIQHFTKTLARVPGVDFELPTAAELQALEAFQLSNRSPADGNFKIAGRNSLLSTAADPRAQDTTRPEVRGRETFLSVGCTTCHGSTVFSGGVTNVDTGVEILEATLANRTPTADVGDCLGQFQTPPLFGLRKPHFFHTGLLGNHTVAVPGETLRFTNIRQAVGFYVSLAFAASPEGPSFLGIQALSDADLDDIAHFLEKISGG